MKSFEERQLVDGSISRKYSDNTFLVYKKWDTENIYIKLIHSVHPGRGIARKHLIDFLNHYKSKNVYIYVSDELGADIKTLRKFYENLGFNSTEKHEVNGERINYIKKATA
jgi:ribosomal protein S18 acetylase RimI-like enzyme